MKMHRGYKAGRESSTGRPTDPATADDSPGLRPAGSPFRSARSQLLVMGSQLLA